MEKIIEKEVESAKLTIKLSFGKTFDEDAERETLEPQVKIMAEYKPKMSRPQAEILAEYKAKKYGFIARNIFDYGLTINPGGFNTAQGYKTGLRLQVE